MLDEKARRGAQKQWDARACGELPGDKQSVAYFDAWARDRYQQRPWMREYFGYERFAGKHVLYTGRSVQRLMAAFRAEDVSVHHFPLSHFMPGTWAGRLPFLEIWIRTQQSRLGWYEAYRGFES